MMDKKTKYPPEMIAQWAKDLQSGKVTKEGIMARSGINRTELTRRLKAMENKKN